MGNSLPPGPTVVVLLLAIALAASPVSGCNFTRLATQNPEFSFLATAIVITGMEHELSSVTFLAPTDAAFDAFAAPDRKEKLLKNPAALAEMLANHAIPGVRSLKELKTGTILDTMLPGGTVAVVFNSSGLYFHPTGGPAVRVTSLGMKCEDDTKGFRGRSLLGAADIAKVENIVVNKENKPPPPPGSEVIVKPVTTTGVATGSQGTSLGGASGSGSGATVTGATTTAKILTLAPSREPVPEVVRSRFPSPSPSYTG